MKILIAVDGSDSAKRAVAHVVASTSWLKAPAQIFLLNVQWKLASGHLKMFISQDTLNDYYLEQGTAALAEARAALDAAGLAYTYHISVGLPAEAIVQYAQEQQVDQITIGAHGEGGLSVLLLGSVVSKVLHLSTAPVLVIK
jgi:nucleotide-binding universal stress UspA family protein